jgi:ribosomal protein S18 acetylase RimI-like enzyme
VSRRHRGRGHGRRLLVALQARYPALKLVARRSSRLLHFYREMGFEEEGRFENYYAAGRDGVRLAWRRRSGAASALEAAQKSLQKK